MNRFCKQSSEEYTVAIDFDEVLDTDETITKKTITAIIHGSTGDDVTDSVILSSAIVSRTVTIKVKNGIDGKTYKITTIIETSADNIYEEDILMKVREI